MAKSSDVGAVSVPRKLTLAERLVLVGPGIAHNVGKHAAARLAFLESLVQDVAKLGCDDFCGLCFYCAYDLNVGHGKSCPCPRLLAAVSDDREDGK